MAEFKLGRIRFIWKGDWSPATTYYKDDIVRNGGNTYVCVQGHVSSGLFTDNQNTFWNKISDGLEWKQDWIPGFYYKVNDIVKYGGNLYIANTAHVSSAVTEVGLEKDSDNWDEFAEGFDYKSEWNVSTRYKENDIVKYGSTIYICVEGHTSVSSTSLGLEADFSEDSAASKWEVFSEGLSWTDEWQLDFRYKKNDVVRYGGQLYICNEPHQSAVTEADGLEKDQEKWDYLHKGIEYKGDWTRNVRYKINDVVKYGGGLWICLTFHTSQTFFTDDENKWAQFVEGLEFEDSWNPTERYQPGDFVTFGGYSFVASTNNIAAKPTESPNDWDLFTAGFKFAGEWAEDSSGQHYKVGEVVTKNGYTYLCIEDHDEQQEPPNTEYWERLNSGIKWRNDVGAEDGSWTSGVDYKLGDTVSYKNGDTTNFYICIQEHTATTDPLNDNGTNWNIVSGGPEQGNLAQPGDLVYYGASGPTVLPIGDPGQVLVVNNDANKPEWRNFGAINHVYFVEKQNGEDVPAPSYGITLDRPWKSVKFATEEVEKGPLRFNTRSLIELNRAFIINETLEWVNDKIALGTGIWAGFTNQDQYISLQEFNSVLNSLIFDIRHSGNEKIRSLTLGYFTEQSLKTDLQDEFEQFVAALEYLESVIISVINNESPAEIYSSFIQNTENPFTSESDASEFINNLFNIIVNAVSAESPASIPAEYKPNNSIFVKTGEFAEILPMSIPENTAVIGDELRSTRIIPAGSVIDPSDLPVTFDAIARLRDIVDPVIFGSDDIGKVSSNSEDYVDTGLVLGDSQSAAEAANLFQQIIDYIDYEINGVSDDSTAPVMVGTNTANTNTNFTYAVEAVEKNKAFLIEEAVEYAKTLNTGVVEDRLRVDVERYIDAVQYDLVYTGNYKSYLAAKHYVHAVKGSKLSDMFYVRNGSGFRNASVKGLDGRSDGNTINTSIKGLSNSNSFGTQRPLAGAFVSLDPGWGPEDTRVWISNKSPYIQNISTFGEGCIGCKIDGDLHNGGNDSIVANDFTQLCSAGIGVWCTNLGRTELVSVFSYYAHIGYLAEDGGKIRATNGNSSYGDFGTVAENVDDTEVPVFGNVDNRAQDAIVRRMFTNGNQVLTAEFANAGVNYTDAVDAVTAIDDPTPVDNTRPEGTYYGVSGTSSGSGTGQEFDITIDNLGNPTAILRKGGSGHLQGDIITILDSDLGDAGGADLQIEITEIGDATRWTITGEGFNAAVDNANTVSGGVFNVRMRNTDVTGNQEGDFGGNGYTLAENVAQGGDTTSITLSNTDTVVIGSQYDGTQSDDGVAIYITAGKGAGQYGYIDSYNPGTKVAQIKKFSDGTAGWDHVVPGEFAIESSLDESTNYSIEPNIQFSDPSGNSLGDVGFDYSSTAKARARVEDERIVEILIWDPGTGYTTDTEDSTYPTLTIFDPNNTVDVPTEVRVGSTGVLTQPTWLDRGQQFATASADIVGDGFASVFQPGSNIQVRNLTDIPTAGSNITFNGISNFYKLVTVRNLTGLGPYTANLQISPEIDIEEAPEHLTDIELRIRFSQVRLTGHDFLDIGTGNFEETNYPNDPEYVPDPVQEVTESGGGRVFFTSTDQDGNFRVGGLFNVEQSTGVATLNADAFNISGLQELQLGAVELGGTGATITEFSTDGTFTANSDNIVPTQKAIKTYIQSQIGGGAGELNVNSITAGSILISGQEITTTTDNQINILQKVNYTGGIGGSPVALNYFLQA